MHLRLPLSRSPFLRLPLFSLLLCLFTTPAARALSVIPPTFAELVAESESIVRGEVTAIRSAYDDSSPGRPIRTYVTFRVARTLKGPAPAGDSVTLIFLGGTVGADSLSVPGMPTFKLGDREIVFVARNGKTYCPLIAAGHGRYRILRDAATQRDYVARENRTPLEDPAEVVLPLVASEVVARLKSPARALSPEEFEARIARAVADPATPAQP
jgi:hypothetical protein